MNIKYNSANAETFLSKNLNKIKELQEEVIVNTTNVFLGEAKAIEDVLKALEDIGVVVDTKHNVFVKQDHVEDGKIILVNDPNLKRQLLKREGFI